MRQPTIAAPLSTVSTTKIERGNVRSCAKK
jgi:hypothetical protein